MKFFILLQLLFLSSNLFAKKEGIFDVQFIIYGGNKEVMKHMEKWTCLGFSSVEHIDNVADHTGSRKNISIKQEASLGDSFLSKQSISSRLHKEISNFSKFRATVIENCYHFENEITMKKQCESGICVDVKSKEIKKVVDIIKWNCTFDSTPSKVGQTVNTKCNLDKASATGSLGETLQGKTVIGHLKLTEIKDTFAADLCQGKDLSKRKIIRISQGLKHLPFENDFNLVLHIAGQKEPIVLERKDALFNDEIAICQDGDVKLQVTAYEKDLFFDDTYSCEGENENRITLNVNNPEKRQSVLNFTRDYSLNQLFLKSKQQIKFEIISAPVPKS